MEALGSVHIREACEVLKTAVGVSYPNLCCFKQFGGTDKSNPSLPPKVRDFTDIWRV